jgi:hypothetical protein
LSFHYKLVRSLDAGCFAGVPKRRFEHWKLNRRVILGFGGGRGRGVVVIVVVVVFSILVIIVIVVGGGVLRRRIRGRERVVVIVFPGLVGSAICQDGFDSTVIAVVR